MYPSFVSRLAHGWLFGLHLATFVALVFVVSPIVAATPTAAPVVVLHSTALQPNTAHGLSAPCVFGGASIDSPTYVIGEEGVVGSVMAVCEHSTLKCYILRSGTSTVQRQRPTLEETDCSEWAMSLRRLQGHDASKNKKSGAKVAAPSTKSAASVAGSTTAATATTSKTAKASTLAKPNGTKDGAPVQVSGPKKPTANTAAKSGNMGSANGDKTASGASSKLRNEDRRRADAAAKASKNSNGKQPNASKHSKASTTSTTPSLKARDGKSTKVAPAKTSKTASKAKSKHTNTTNLHTTKPICMHKGTRIRGLQRMYDETEWYYAICNEYATPPTLTCYKDRRIADTTAPDPEVPCEDVPAVTKEAAASKAGKRQLAVRNPRKHVWPFGVVCYKLGSGPSLVNSQRQRFSQERFNQIKPQVTRLISNAMGSYTEKVGIWFLEMSNCAEQMRRMGRPICGQCKSWVQITFDTGPINNEKDCSSHIGYSGSGRTQGLNLGAECWNHVDILHQLGHTLGLSHDHQHPDRQVIIDLWTIEAYLARRHSYLVSNYAIDSNAIDGAPDLESIMHANSDAGLCIRKQEYRETKFCDAFENPNAVKDPDSKPCTAAIPFIHCDTSRKLAFGRARDLSAGDIDRLERMYGGEILAREDMIPQTW